MTQFYSSLISKALGIINEQQLNFSYSLIMFAIATFIINILCPVRTWDICSYYGYMCFSNKNTLFKINVVIVSETLIYIVYLVLQSVKVSLYYLFVSLFYLFVSLFYLFQEEAMRLEKTKKQVEEGELLLEK